MVPLVRDAVRARSLTRRHGANSSLKFKKGDRGL